MNKDQIKGSTKAAAGKMQRKAGKATGSVEQQVKGAAREATGKAQQQYGGLKKHGDKLRAH